MDSPDFKVGQKVWLIKGLTVKNQKRKLADQMMGPFEIIRKVSPLAYELDLPVNFRCHPIFHVSVKDLHLKMYIPYTFNYVATIIT